MRTDEFWLMVQRSRAPRDEAAGLIVLTTELQALGEKGIAAFVGQLRHQIAELDTLELRDIATQLWVLSDEGWLHCRAWWVSQGREFVTRLHTEPSRVLRALAASRRGPFDPPNGELFLYCADYARVAGARAVA